MSNHNDEPYDDVPECCCAGMEENKKLKREIAELKAMVNELRDALLDIQMLTDNTSEVCEENTEQSCLIATKAIHKAAAQSLHDHDMAISEAVREACKNKASSMYLDENSAAILVEDEIDSIDLSTIVKGVK